MDGTHGNLVGDGHWYKLYMSLLLLYMCLLLRVSSDYAQPITGQVTEVTCPVIGWAQPKLTPSNRQKMGPVCTFLYFTELLPFNG